MKLPEIEYQIPLQNPVQAAGAPWEAAGRAADVFAAGFQMLGQERIKTQTQEAAVALSEKLSKAEQEAKRKPFWTTQEVEDVLGRDGVPDHVRPYFDQVDPATGQPALIPAYEIGDAIFRKRASEAVAESSKQITTTGWQAEFQQRAQEHVTERAHQLALHNLQAAGSYLQAQQEGQADRLVNVGDFAGARAIIASSNAIPPAQKERLFGKVLEAEQTKPVSDALLSENRQDISTMIGKLQDPEAKEFNAISPKERTSYLHALEAKGKAMDREAELAVEKARAKKADGVRGYLANLELAASKTGQPVSAQRAFAAIPVDTSITGEQRQSLVTYAQAISDPKKAERKSDLALYQALAFEAYENPDGFRDDKIRVPTSVGTGTVGLLDLAGRLSEADFKHFVALQTGLKKEGREASMYQDFLGTEQLVNTKLRTEYKYDLRTTNAQTQEDIGRLKQMVNLALSQASREKGGRLTTPERDGVVDRVLKAEVKIKPNLIFADEKVLATAGVQPDVAVTLANVSERGGHRMSNQDIIETAKDFGFYQGGIEAAWAAQSARPLGVEAAVDVYTILKTRWHEIDAELVRAGALKPDQLKTQAQKDAANRLRAAGAVQLYLKGAR